MPHVLKVACLVAAAALVAVPAGGQNLFDQGRKLLEGAAGSGGSGGGSGSTTGTALGQSTIADGLRQALEVGIGQVVGTLGRPGGFAPGTDAHIPLPGVLGQAQGLLAQVGMGGLTADLEQRMNRAAEAAVPKAQPILLDAVRSMTLEDARRILDGPQDAATRYFEGRMRTPLADELSPVVATELSGAGAVQAYDQVAGRLATMPFAPDVKTDLTGYVTDKALEAVFDYLATEEAAIRADPAKRTTDLLRQVFAR